MVGVGVVLEQAGVVVEHLFEVGNDPALVDGIAMESAGELVVDTSVGHLFEGDDGGLLRGFVAGADSGVDEQIDRRGMGKFGLRSEAAVVRVELRDGVLHELVDQAEAELTGAAGEGLAVFDGGHDAAGGLGNFVALGLPDIGHGAQDAGEAGAAVALFGREICAAEVWLAVGSEDGGERPASLAGHRLHGGLVAAVDVGALVAVDLDGDEVFIDDLGERGVLVRLAVHHMAPVAPDGADVEQDGLVLGDGLGKGFLAPLMPLHRLVHRRTQVGGRGVPEGVCGFGGGG